MCKTSLTFSTFLSFQFSNLLARFFTCPWFLILIYMFYMSYFSFKQIFACTLISLCFFFFYYYYYFLPAISFTYVFFFSYNCAFSALILNCACGRRNNINEIYWQTKLNVSFLFLFFLWKVEVLGMWIKKKCN